MLLHMQASQAQLLDRCPADILQLPAWAVVLFWTSSVLLTCQLQLLLCCGAGTVSVGWHSWQLNELDLSQHPTRHRVRQRM